jgi:hypothetical protein
VLWNTPDVYHFDPWGSCESPPSVASNVVKVKSELPSPDLLKKMKADPNVELASLNYKRYISAVPNDEYYTTDQKTYLGTARGPQAWDLSKTTGTRSSPSWTPASTPATRISSATSCRGTTRCPAAVRTRWTTTGTGP